MKNWTEIIKNVSMLTQFGLSFVTPLLLCLAVWEREDGFISRGFSLDWEAPLWWLINCIFLS